MRLQTKPRDTDVNIVIDPYKPAAGNFPRSLTADIALYTKSTKNSITISGNPFDVETAGEFEVKGVLITAAPGHESGQTLLRLDCEKISFGHTGYINKQLTDQQLEVLAGVDILCLPVGGGDGYEPEAASKVISAVEPRIVIPLAFKSDTDPQATPVSDFIKEVGLTPEKEEKKVILKKKDLPQEDMKVIVIEKE